MIIINRRKLYSYILLFFTLLSAGCSTIDRPEQIINERYISLNQDIKLGQSFLARYNGLNGFGIYLKPEKMGDGNLILSLLSVPTENDEIIGRSILPLREIKSTGYHPIIFNPQEKSTNQYYFVSLEVEGEGSVQIGTGQGNTYLNGALYQNGTPENAQMMFNLCYDGRLLIVGLIKEGFYWFILLSVCLWLYILPGWALLSLLYPKWRTLHWYVKISLSAGVSLAIYPILLLWTYVVGLRLGSLYAWIPPLIGFMIILWKNRILFSKTDKISLFLSDKKNLIYQNINSPRILLPNLLIIFILLMVILTRFWVIRNLDLPMWGDSYQHTMIVQLLLDNDGLFQSWLPYTTLDTFTYHFGFHANTAVFSWLTGIPAAEAVLWTGQFVNIFAVLTLIPLAMKILNSHWVGVFSLLIAGLITELPAFYINWGRYTQLTGQVILLTGTFCIWVLLEKVELDWKLLGVNWLLTGGLVLAHYRVMIFGILFLPAFWLLNLRRNNLQHILGYSVLYGFGASLFALPWLINLTKGNILNIFNNQLTTSPRDLSSEAQTYNAIGGLEHYLPVAIWLIFVLGLCWLLWKQNRGAALIGLWWLLVLLFTNPAWFDLPGSGTISNFALFIAAYIPATLIISSATSSLIPMERELSIAVNSAVRRFSQMPIQFPIMFILVISISVWGSLRQKNIANVHQFALATRPDIRAAEWIEAMLLDDARFLINGFLAFQGSEVVGSDGGWWLPLLAHRQTFLTPLSSGFEQGDEIQESAEVELVRAIEGFGLDDPTVLKILGDQRLTHVYIGQRQGSVNSSGPLLDIDSLRKSKYYEETYHQDRVWVFEINYGAEGP